MAITLQGSWSVSVKSKSAAFAQRFVISGADINNGPHSGTPGTSVFVSGAQWSINLQSQAPGQPWRDSAQRITFPTASASLVQFDIRSDDTAGDQDYNDLVLTCSMPVSASEFVIYGTAKTYAGLCRFNPCFPWYWVIDNYAALLEALKVPVLAGVIRKLYPERVPRRPVPLPDPPPDFKPMVIPSGLPMENRGFVFRSARTGLTAEELQAGAKDEKFLQRAVERLRGTVSPVVLDGAPVEAGISRLTKAEISAVAQLADKYRAFPVCDVELAPGLLLGFQEYDRTDAEKLGGPYTGAGSRRGLGVAATDEQGNYIFRFSQSLADIAEESTDVGPGESVSAQIFPDVIVQALGTGMSVDYESAPYDNIPNLYRINLCLPYGSVHPSQGCSGDRVTDGRIAFPQAVFWQDLIGLSSGP